MCASDVVDIRRFILQCSKLLWKCDSSFWWDGGVGGTDLKTWLTTVLLCTLHWTSRVVRGPFSVICLAPASLLSSSSSDRRLRSLSSRDSLSSAESSAVLSLLSSASVGPSLVSASGDRTLALRSRASPLSRVMLPSRRRLWTMLWGC